MGRAGVIRRSLRKSRAPAWSGGNFGWRICQVGELQPQVSRVRGVTERRFEIKDAFDRDPKLANRWSRGISEVPADLGRWLDQLVKASARVTPPSWRQK